MKFRKKTFVFVLGMAFILSLMANYLFLTGVDNKYNKAQAIVSNEQNNDENNEQNYDKNKPKLTMGVISDIHIGDKGAEARFIKALNDFKNIAPEHKVLAMVGDITNQGREKQYDIFNKILNDNLNPGVEKVISIGNHEYFEGREKGVSVVTDKVYSDRFINKTGMPGLYYDKWIEGYHFLVLGGEASALTNPEYGDSAILSKEQYDWLEKTISINTDSKKPIFIFIHQPIDDTVYGSETLGGGFRDGKLASILRRYPQVIVFSGHSHFILNHPRTLHQDGFTTVNTSSVDYTEFAGGELSRKYSQGLLVQVYEDKVEIKAREFSDSTWIQSYTINLPYEKTIKDSEKPYFKVNTKASLDKVESNRLTISWDAAEDNRLVDKYYIKNQGKILKTEYIRFWENDKEHRVTTIIDNLELNKEYELEIFAVDAWNNECITPLKITVGNEK